MSQERKEKSKQHRLSMKNQFDALMKRIESAPDEQSGQIIGKLELLLDAKELAGDLWAAWENEAKSAKTVKKEVINYVKIYGAVLRPDKPFTDNKEVLETIKPVEAKEPSTDKMREAIAELVAKPYEDEENKATASSGHYKNKWESITERIQVLKKKHDFLNPHKG